MYSLKKFAVLFSMIALGSAPLCASAAPHVPVEISHSKVEAFDAEAPQWQFAWQPHLKLYMGCHPYPAVQANGDWSKGLQNTGPIDGDCTDSGGQVYSRFHQYPNKQCAVMFSWYFPKDGTVPGGDLVDSGHRHDWENIIVYLNSCSKKDPARENLVAIAYSQHDAAEVRVGYDANEWHDNTKHMKVLYSKRGVYNHALYPTSDNGGSQPLIAWNSLTPAARKTLNTKSFGKAGVPFKDGKFEQLVNENAPEGFPKIK